MRNLRNCLLAGMREGRGQKAFVAFVLALTVLFVMVVQLRVVTYVCGNDPMLYQRAARVILQPGLYGWGLGGRR